MQIPNVGQVVGVVLMTKYGKFVLPGEVAKVEDDGQLRLRLYYDDTFGSDFVVNAYYSKGLEPDTWFFLNTKPDLTTFFDAAAMSQPAPTTHAGVVLQNSVLEDAT